MNPLAIKTDNLIAINEFCIHHNIEISFISLLQQNGLIDVTTVKETSFVDAEELLKLEKIIRFYFEMDINLEGIESITHLLQRIMQMQSEIIGLKNRLRLYEPDE